MSRLDISKLGEPTLQIGRLKLWIHGRQFPDADDYWDGNWLSVTAYYHRQESSVMAGGPLVHLGELWGLYKGCVRMNEASAGEAALECVEPNLGVRLRAGPTGRITVETTITPDHLTESHNYEDEIDLSYLPAVISSCECVFAAYPVREPAQLAPGNDA